MTMSRSLETNHDTHVLFRVFNTKNAQKYQKFYLATQMEHDKFSYFCLGPDDFCWGPAPVGPTLVTGSNVCWSHHLVNAHKVKPVRLNNRCAP